MNDQPRPPYVRFETRAVEDRTQTLEQGKPAYRDVIYAIVTPAGTKDQLEKVADEWIESCREGVKQDRIPPSWLDAFEAALKRYKENQDDPEVGTSIRNWSGATPAQAKMLLDLNLRTVEDVAAMTEEAILHIGMGGRALRDRARAWLDTAKDTGHVAGELEALRRENEDLRARDTEREALLKAMNDRLTALEGVPAQKSLETADEEE